MLSKRVFAATIVLTLVSPVDCQDMRKLTALSQKKGWVFLAYYLAHNKTFHVSGGQVDVIYPKTAVVKDLGLDGYRDVDHRAYPSFSSTGDYAAFVRRFSASMPDEAITIHSFRDNTSRDLVRLPMQVYGVASSPDGKAVAFIAKYNNDRASRFGLYVVGLHDPHVNALTPLVRLDPNTSISWSPNGKEIVVQEQLDVSSKEAHSYAVVVVNRETRARRVAEYGRDPSWSPDGELIAYVDEDGENCHTIKPDGTNKQRLFSYKESPFFARGYRLTGPLVWSPDMRYLIYHREDGSTGDKRKIYLFDLKSKKQDEIFSGSRLEIMTWAIAERK